MKNKLFNSLAVKAVVLFLAVVLLMATGYSQGQGDSQKGLRIYLPREMVVKGDTISLGSIGIVRGQEDLIAKAGDIALGSFALAGQQIIIDKNTILSRLATNGIKGADVSLSGAEYVTVKRDEKVIGGGRFDEVARGFLKSSGVLDSVSEMTLIKHAKDWPLTEGDGKIELVARKSSYSTPAKRKVWVGVVRDGVEIGGRELVFNLRYLCRRAAAIKDIKVGQLITSENVKIEKVQMNIPQASDWREPYGQVARHKIKKGGTISGNMVGPLELPVMIKRNQQVILKIETPGLSISNFGKALSDGKEGECIRVEVGNSRSRRVVVGMIKKDGTVEPVY